MLGGSARQFGAVLAIAQKILRDTFGMELVELASRAGREQERQLAEDFKEELKAGRLRRMGKYIPKPLGRLCIDSLTHLLYTQLVLGRRLTFCDRHFVCLCSK